ncbi:hypothetical protein CR513_61091, partial [Mucuna pruriens]
MHYKRIKEQIKIINIQKIKQYGESLPDEENFSEGIFQQKQLLTQMNQHCLEYCKKEIHYYSNKGLSRHSKSPGVIQDSML